MNTTCCTIDNWYWVIVSDTLGQSKIGNGKTNEIELPPTIPTITSVTYYDTKNTNDKASGKQKLKDLGLNDDEIKALTGA